ncbi:MAG: FGGY family carbohydrate kinase [Caldilineaceae bacterium]
MAQNDLILGIDVGTTSVKGALYKLDGECLLLRSLAYPTMRPRPGWVEQDPAEWMTAIRTICAEAQMVADGGKIVALGLTSQVNTHVFVDANGNALLPAITWQDQRCAAAAAKLDQMIPDDLRAVCWGSDFKPDASFLMSRVQWLVDEEPDLWQRTRWVLAPKDYCLLQLTGAVASDAISSVRLTDERGAYVSAAFGLIDGLAERLPALQPIEAVVGTVKAEFLRDTPPAVVGIMDAWAALYGSGLAQHGDAYQVAGTSEVLGIISNANHGAPGVITFPPLAGWYMHAGPTQLGGAAASWFADFMKLASIEEVFTRAQQAMAHDQPLLFLPHLMGERAPLWDSNAKGAFLGMTGAHTVNDLARATLEGVGHASRLLLERLEQAAGFPVAALKLSGGGARSELWCQIKADIMDRPLQRLANIDTGPFGAALIAGVGTGIYVDYVTASGEAVKVDREFVPDGAKRNYYDALFGLYQESYQALVRVNAGFSERFETSL